MGVSDLRSIYRRYSGADLQRHPGIVLWAYSVMSYKLIDFCKPLLLSFTWLLLQSHHFSNTSFFPAINRCPCGSTLYSQSAVL